MYEAIKIEDLSKKYRIYDKKIHILFDLLPDFIKKLFNFDTGKDIWVIKDLNLMIKKGERLGIIGENGTGKSTLLKLICQYIKPNYGRISICGKPHSLLSLGSGFLPNLNAYQNIQAYFAFNNVNLEKKTIESILDFAELGDYANQPVKLYSSGMFARFAFAVMTEIKPEILIIDEILGAGDAYFMGKCIERLNRLTQNENMTLIFVSHDMSSIQQVCSRTIWLHKGCIKADGQPLQVIKEYQAHIRNKENIRLMEKQISIPHNTLHHLQIKESTLFRVIASEGNSQHSIAAIYKIEIERVGFRESLEVGNALDNDLNQAIAIIEASGKTDWGKPGKDKNGLYRSCLNYSSQFQHAPFAVRISQFLRKKNEGKDANIQISYKSNVSLLLQIYNEIEHDYITIGELEATNLSFRKKQISFAFLEYFKPPSSQEVNAQIEKPIDLPLATFEDEKEQNYLATQNSYGSREIYIKNVEILDEGNMETRVLSTGHTYKIRIHYYTNMSVINPVFVFCVYTPEGLCVSQFIKPTKDIGKEIINEEGCIDFIIPNLCIGAKDYVASAAIFKTLNISKQEPESYHVLDRCIFFKVEDLSVPYERGICLQPYQATVRT